MVTTVLLGGKTNPPGRELTQLVALHRAFGGTVVTSTAFHLWDRGFDSRYGLMWEESVNALPKVVGFLRVLQFPPTGEVDRVG